MVEMKKPELDAQCAVLGSVLIEPDIIGEVLQTVREEDFGDSTCKTIFAAIRDLYIAGSRIDAVVVLHAVGDQYRDYLSQLMDVTPTAAGWKSYAAIMKEQAKLYRIRTLAAELEASMSVADAQSIISRLHDELSDRSRRVVTLSDGFKMFLHAQETNPAYLEFGIDPLDDGRLFAAKGDFIVIGARPSVGKTALAIQMARHIGKTQKVGFFSLETGAEKFFDRYVSNATGTFFGRIKRRELDEQDWPYISKAIRDDVKDIRLEMIDASGMSVDDIRAMTLARRFDVIFVDYLQLISGRERDSYSRVTNISMGLHNLAQQANVAVIALAQLRRAERQKDKKTGKSVEYAPTLSDLRESGQIEQDADVVMLMYLSDPDRPASDRILRVAKNKEGQRGKVTLMFDGSRQRFDIREEEAPSKNRQAETQRPKIADAKQIAMPGLMAGRRIY
ncbi:MAG: hypothetical protein LUE11_05325 [Clostridia bacterium]|nr:hypothetical protein [Clostridia bacterium]